MHRCLAVIFALWLGLQASPCRAATPAPPNTTAPQSHATATLPEPSSVPTPNPLTRQEVEQRYARALKLYAKGDLRGSIQLLTECYEATHAANLLFNLAQLHRELDDCSAAVDYYQRYLDDAKEGERIKDARQFLDTLSPQCQPKTEPAPAPAPAPETPRAPEPQSAGAKPPAAPPPSPAPLPLPKHGYWSSIGWVALGTGAIATVAAVYASVKTNRAYHDVEHPRMTSEGAIDGDFLAMRQDDFYRSRTWAYALGAAAITTTGFGIYALAIAAPKQRAKGHTLSMVVLRNSASVSYSLRF